MEKQDGEKNPVKSIGSNGFEMVFKLLVETIAI